MHPRVNLRMTAGDRTAVSQWWRRMIASIAALCALLFGADLVWSHFISDAGTNERPLASACADWDSAASDAVSMLVREQSDASARQANDALFRLRRARRNCRAGWIGLACRDYQALVRPADRHAALCSPEMIDMSAEVVTR